jgi:hypothetical protein
MVAAQKFTSYWVRSRDITYADAATTVGAISVPANSYVDKVIAVVQSTWDTVGAGTIDCGDGSDPDGWIDGLQLSGGVVGVYIGTGGHSVYYTGKAYTTADTIDVYTDSGTRGSLFIMARITEFGDID